jgi:hypothetical protein
MHTIPFAELAAAALMLLLLLLLQVKSLLSAAKDIDAIIQAVPELN